MATAAPALSAQEQVIASGLDPWMLPRMLQHRALDIAAGIPFVLISGRRGYDQQAQLYADYQDRLRVWEAGGKVGPAPQPAAQPGSSMHELGFAYDRTGPRTDAEWRRSAEHAQSVGLESGYFYRNQDRPHVEAPEPIEHVRTVVAMRVAAAAAAVGLLWAASRT